MLRSLASLLVLGGCWCVVTPAQAADSASVQLARLADDYWEADLRASPELATLVGDHRFDDRLSDLSEAARTRRQAELASLGQRLEALPRATLTADERVTVDVLRFALDVERDGHRFRFDRSHVDQLGGPQVAFNMLLLDLHPRREARDFENLVKRCQALPAYLEEYRARLAEGLATQSSPRVVVERVVKQLDELVSKPPEASPIAHLLDAPPPSLASDPKRVAALRRSLLEAVRDHVQPAWVKLRDYLRRDYLPRARNDVGLSARSDGEAAYVARIRQHTTTSHTPAELHKMGVEEVARIEQEMVAIAARLGHKGDLRSFLQALRGDGKPLRDAETVLRTFREILARFDAQLGKVVTRRPRLGYQVQAVPAYSEGDSGAYYNQPTPDGTRPGTFFVNVRTMRSATDAGFESLAAHEGVPGHHLQTALAMELENVPRVRRFAEVNAYVEGWALYAERLVDELGLYSSDRARFGMLSAQSFRACRLVVDTGLHALRWTRQQALDYVLAHSGMPLRNLENEIDRYIAIPGQALGYTVGELEIFAARTAARRALGDRFSLPAFNDQVLGAGAVPLSTMRRNIDEWVAAQLKKKAP